MLENLIGKEKYFVHKGTWENNYEWRIQKVKITGIKIDEQKKMYVEFHFNCCGYEYLLSDLKDTLKSAKKFAIEKMNKEKIKQMLKINSYE